MRPGFLPAPDPAEGRGGAWCLARPLGVSPVFGGFLMALIGLHDAGGEVAPQFRLIGDPGLKERRVEGHRLRVAAGQQVGFLEVPADDVAEGEVEVDGPRRPRPHDVEGGRSAEGEDVAAGFDGGFP